MEPTNIYPNNIHDVNSALIFLTAGVMTAIATQLIIALWKIALRHFDKRILFRNLCLELHYNLKTIQESLDELHTLEKHVLAHTTESYVPKFELYKVMTITLNSMYISGILYKELTLKELQGLQIFANIFNAATNSDVRNKIEIYRSSYKNDPTIYPLMVRMLPLWRKQLEDSKTVIEEVFGKLARKYKYQIKE